MDSTQQTGSIYRILPILSCMVHVAVYLQAGNVTRYSELMERSGGRLGPPDRCTGMF